MAFKSISTNIVLLFLIFNFHRQFVAPYVMPVYDATYEQLKTIQASPFYSIPALKVKSPEEVHNAVMKGRGVEIQRKADDQIRWSTFIRGKSSVDIANDFAKSRGWSGPSPSGSLVPQVLSPDMVTNTDWVQFTRAEYPIDLPPGVEHWILWIRGPMTTRESFHALPGEVIPNSTWLAEDKLDDLIKFIHAHDAFGSNVESKKYDQSLEVGEKLIAASPEAKHGYAGEVSAEEGIKAMLWSGRHITRLIAAKYPGQDFDWFRVNRSLRTFHVPNEIHVLVRQSK